MPLKGSRQDLGLYSLDGVRSRLAFVAGLAPTLGTISVDSADAAASALWWAEVLEGSVDEFPDIGFHVVRCDRLAGLNLAFQQTPHPTPGKNRIHLDFGAADREATVEHLVALGAARIGEHEYQGLRWSVLADPDGNQFCVSDAP